MLINRLGTCPKCILSCDLVNDQFLDRSYVIFPGSRVVKSHNVIVAEGSHNGSHVGSCDRFPQLHDLEVTWL